MGRLLWWVAQALFFVKQSIKSTFYLPFVLEKIKVTKHSFIMMHIIFSTFKFVFCNFPLRFVVMMTQLVLSIPSLLLFSFLSFFFFWLHILTHSLSYSYSSFMDRTSSLLRNIAYLVWWLIRIGDLVVCFLFCLFRISFLFQMFFFYLFCYKLWILMFRQDKMCWFWRLPNRAVS